MSQVSGHVSQAPSRAMEGITCVVLGMFFFVFQDALMKDMIKTFPVWMLIFIRSTVTVCILTPLILYLGGPHRLLTPFWPWHLARGALFSVGFTLFYAAFPFMGLAEVTTIFFSGPLITALLAVVLLRETMGMHRIGALAVGFVGVIIAMNPTGQTFQWVAILPLICAVTYAFSQILARKVGEQESTLTMGLHTLAFSGILILPMGWAFNQMVDVGPEFHHLRLAFPAEFKSELPSLVLMGVIGMIAYILISRAYQVANASLVAPFDYAYLPMATTMAYVLFDEIPPVNTLLGMALIITSGLYLGYRELQSSRRGDHQSVVAEATFIPGNPPPLPSEDDPYYD